MTEIYLGVYESTYVYIVPLLSASGPATPEMVRLVSFQASTAASTNSSLQHRPEFPSLAAVTLNLWARFRHFSTAVDTMVSYFHNNDDLIQFCKLVLFVVVCVIYAWIFLCNGK